MPWQTGRWNGMVHNNPWFLMTADEMNELSKDLQEIGTAVPEEYHETLKGAFRILNHIQGRQA